MPIAALTAASALGGTILVEERHDRIADEFVDESAVLVDWSLHLGQIFVEKIEQCLRGHSFRDRGE